MTPERTYTVMVQVTEAVGGGYTPEVIFMREQSNDGTVLKENENLGEVPVSCSGLTFRQYEELSDVMQDGYSAEVLATEEALHAELRRRLRLFIQKLPDVTQEEEGKQQ